MEQEIDCEGSGTASQEVFRAPGVLGSGRRSILTLVQPQEMMKAATIGRSSEFGNGWEPPGMVRGASTGGREVGWGGRGSGQRRGAEL